MGTSSLLQTWLVPNDSDHNTRIKLLIGGGSSASSPHPSPVAPVDSAERPCLEDALRWGEVSSAVMNELALCHTPSEEFRQFFAPLSPAPKDHSGAGHDSDTDFELILQHCCSPREQDGDTIIGDASGVPQALGLKPKPSVLSHNQMEVEPSTLERNPFGPSSPIFDMLHGFGSQEPAADHDVSIPQSL